jgi:DHA2 family methylenomycin A resistance protein-like MFS transporter
MNSLPGQAGLAAGVLNAARRTGGALVGALLPAAGMWLVAAAFALVGVLALDVRQSS